MPHIIQLDTGVTIMAQSVFEQFAAAATDLPAAVFLCFPGLKGLAPLSAEGEITYGEALTIVEALADAYRAAGYSAGHRIAAVLGNTPAHFFHLLALNSLGACVVTINPEGRPHELAYGVSFPDCAAVLAIDPWRETLEAVVADFPSPIPVIDGTPIDRPLPPPGRAPASAPASAPDAVLRRAALIIYTSGTTGQPKGCVISNESCLAAGASYVCGGDLIAFRRGGDRLYTPLPSFHMNLSVFCLNAVTQMANCLIVQDRFSVTSWWKDIAETRATCFQYLGIIPPLLVKTAPGPYDRAHQARFGYGAGVDPAVREAFESRFGVPLIEAWGMTETSRAIHNSFSPRCLEPRAFGRPLPPWEVRVVDDEDRPLPFDSPGELLVRASGSDPRAGFFSGYLNMPEATEHAWRGGWFHTGDIVRQRADGMLFFVDRRKNIIRRSGENIAAAEIEEALLVQPQVQSASAIAVPDELHDEEVMVCVVPMEGVATDRATAEAIQRAAAAILGVAKVPAWIAFLDALPVTRTEKVQKGLLFPEGVDPRDDPRTHDLRDAKRALRLAEKAKHLG